MFPEPVERREQLVRLQAMHAHELGPEISSQLPERAVGAWVATDRIAGRHAVAWCAVSHLDLLEPEHEAMMRDDLRRALDNLAGSPKPR